MQAELKGVKAAVVGQAKVEARAVAAGAEAAAAKSHGEKSEAAAESLPAVTGEVTSPSKVTSNQSSKSCAIV